MDYTISNTSISLISDRRDSLQAKELQKLRNRIGNNFLQKQKWTAQYTVRLEYLDQCETEQKFIFIDW